MRNLAANPRPQGNKKLKGQPGFRIRFADYRIIYNIDDDILTVFILIIGIEKKSMNNV
jgi:mRNA interferase RelE/StbE